MFPHYFLAWLLFLSCVSVSVAETADKATKPNVIIIVADDLGAVDLACYGADLHETPNLDRLASEGVFFTNAYASAAICTPTRAALMTGKTPARLNMTIWHEQAMQGPDKTKPMLAAHSEPNLALSELTLAELFKQAEYRTVHLGKWHLGDAAHFPENHGFDTNIGGTMWGAPPTFFYPFKGGFGRAQEPRYIPDMEWSKPGDYLTDRLTDKALEQIDLAGDKPFFLNLAYYTVHTPIEAKEEEVAYFESKIKQGLKHDNPVYAAMVKSLDENVGRVLNKLDEKGLTENTIVIFTSDNGGFTRPYRGRSKVTTNAPLRSGKGSLYEGGVRVPLLVKGPLWKQGGRSVKTPVITHDILPTLTSACQLKDEEAQSREGQSWLPLLTGSDQQSFAKRDLYFHYPHYYFGGISTPCSAIRSGKWKLIYFYEQNQIELYNLNTDPSETKNVAQQHPKIKQHLQTNLANWLKETKAQMPKPNPDWVEK